MSKLLVYLLEVSVLLVILYGLYALLLRKLTFFSLNRFFLLAILVFSLIIPLLSLDLLPSADRVVNRPVAELRDMRLAYYQALDDWVFEAQSSGSDSEVVQTSQVAALSLKKWVLMMVVVIYGVGCVALISRTIWTYLWMHRLKISNAQEVIDGVLVVKVPYAIAPFSFLKAVFVHAETLQDESFQQILAHEKTHIDQRHSIDLIFVQLIAALLWFNPVVWQIIKSLKATHEYIVDKQMINQGYSLVEYQTLLLRQLISNNSYGLVHNFNLSFIKKRITMMKVKESGLAGKAKVAAAIIAVAVFSIVIVQCNAKLENEEVLLSAPSLVTPPPPPIALPQLEVQGNYKEDFDLSNSMAFSMADGVLTINGKVSTLDDVATALEASGSNAQTIMALRVARDEPMGLVRDLQDILRKHNRRKVLYRAMDQNSKALDLAMLLPPHPDSAEGANWPVIDDAFAKKNNVDIMKIKVSDNLGQAYKDLVRDFVKRNISQGKDNYVVSYKPEDSDSYGDFFTNLFYINRGFDLIYDERAQELYGKDFYNINRKAPGGNEEYMAVRQGIPRAISIAERD
ncbi:MAG: M56 family metallopeptidase [Marinoscillum sp.]